MKKRLTKMIILSMVLSAVSVCDTMTTQAGTFEADINGKTALAIDVEDEPISTDIRGKGAIIIGTGTIADGEGSVSVGAYAVTRGELSLALGAMTFAKEETTLPPSAPATAHMPP